MSQNIEAHLFNNLLTLRKFEIPFHPPNSFLSCNLLVLKNSPFVVNMSVDAGGNEMNSFLTLMFVIFVLCLELVFLKFDKGTNCSFAVISKNNGKNNRKRMEKEWEKNGKRMST